MKMSLPSMKRGMFFVAGQFILFWLFSFSVFLTSGNGENWARWRIGISYDANEFSLALAIILLVMLFSAISLMFLCYYFLKSWQRWHHAKLVPCEKSVIVATVPLPFLFFYFNGFEPFFPLLSFVSHLVTTWYGMPRLMTYVAIPIMTTYVAVKLLPRISGGYIKTFFSIMAALLAAPVVVVSDQTVGGKMSGPFAYLNLADSSVHIYVTSAVCFAYIGCALLLIHQDSQQKSSSAVSTS